MSSSLQEQPFVRTAPSCGFDRFAYEQAFIQAALRLRGINGAATFSQWATGKKILYLYDLKIAVERIRRPDLDPQFLVGGLERVSGAEHAFMLLRFGSVEPPDAQQSKAFSDWLGAGGQAETA